MINHLLSTAAPSSNHLLRSVLHLAHHAVRFRSDADQTDYKSHVGLRMRLSRHRVIKFDYGKLQQGDLLSKESVGPHLEKVSTAAR